MVSCPMQMGVSSTMISSSSSSASEVVRSMMASVPFPIAPLLLPAAAWGRGLWASAPLFDNAVRYAEGSLAVDAELMMGIDPSEATGAC